MDFDNANAHVAVAAAEYARVGMEVLKILNRSGCSENKSVAVKNVVNSTIALGIFSEDNRLEAQNVVRFFLRSAENAGILYVSRGIDGGVRMGGRPPPSAKHRAAAARKAKEEENRIMEKNILYAEIARLRAEAEANKNDSNSALAELKRK